MSPKRKHQKADQVSGQLIGELAAYEQVGLYQHSVNPRSAYRYRGILLTYQKFLDDEIPSLAASQQYLASMRKGGYAPGTIKLHRAALKGFHEWRGENFSFSVREPKPDPAYVEPDVVERMLELSEENPEQHLIIRLMADAGLRRDECQGRW